MSSNSSPPVTLGEQEQSEGGKEGGRKEGGGQHWGRGGWASCVRQTHSQVKDQVMETLLGDAVVESHCGGREKETQL